MWTNQSELLKTFLEKLKAEWLASLVALFSVPSISYFISKYFIIDYLEKNNLNNFRLEVLTATEISSLIFFGLLSLFFSMMTFLLMTPLAIKGLNQTFNVDEEKINFWIYVAILFSPIFAICIGNFYFLLLVLFPLLLMIFEYQSTDKDSKKNRVLYLILLGFIQLISIAPFIFILPIIDSAQIEQTVFQYALVVTYWLIYSVLFGATINLRENGYKLQLFFGSLMIIVLMFINITAFSNATAKLIGLQDSQESWYAIPSDEFKLYKKTLKSYVSDIDGFTFVKGKMVLKVGDVKIFCPSGFSDKRDCLNLSNTSIRYVPESVAIQNVSSIPFHTLLIH